MRTFATITLSFDVEKPTQALAVAYQIEALLEGHPELAKDGRIDRLDLHRYDDDASEAVEQAKREAVQSRLHSDAGSRPSRLGTFSSGAATFTTNGRR